MTEPMVDDALVVMQADRDAAADWTASIGGVWSNAMRAGETDDHDLVQAFARHRLAGVAAGREEASTAIREVRLAEAAYADGRAGAVNRLDAALKALFVYEVPVIRQMGEG